VSTLIEEGDDALPVGALNHKRSEDDDLPF
jgi:hypothetical protein